MLNVSASVFGDAAVAAVTISNKIYLLVRNIIIGIGQGFQPVAGYNYGARNYRRTREAFWFATKLGTVINIIATVVIAMNAPAVITWFRNDPEVIRIGTHALYFACAVMPLMAFSTYVNQIFQCIGLRVPATFLASCRQGVCFIPLALILPRVLGLTGVEMLQPGADLLTFFIAVPFLIHLFSHQLSLGAETGKD
jgi:Na+-driven multidrug efflux pump